MSRDLMSLQGASEHRIGVGYLVGTGDFIEVGSSERGVSAEEEHRVRPRDEGQAGR